MNLSDRDLETLSAYLDGEISRKDRERLEARLQSDEALRNYLEGLQRTRAVIRSLPAMRAPRNYYLSPEMLGQKRTPRRFFPVFSFASALATVFFVLLLVGDFLTVSLPAFAPQRALQDAETVIQAIETTVGGTPQFESELPEDLADQVLERSPVEEGSPGTAADAPEAAAEAQELLPSLEKLFSTSEPEILEEFAGEMEGITAPMEEPGIQVQGSVSVTPLPDEIQPVIPFRGILRILEVVMILVAISSGIAAFFLYRRD